jgi:magnesium chelatase family protein
LFDLAMAISALKELSALNEEIRFDTAFIGTLSLDGTIESAEGLLLALIAAKALGLKLIYIPDDPSIPINMLHGLELVVVSHIKEVVQHLQGQERFSFLPKPLTINQTPQFPETIHKDFCHVIGHEQAKQTLEIAAAGEHNLLMSGPPGCGKSLLAETFPSILPTLKIHALLEVMSLYQHAGEKRKGYEAVPYRQTKASYFSFTVPVSLFSFGPSRLLRAIALAISFF